MSKLSVELPPEGIVIVPAVAHQELLNRVAGFEANRRLMADKSLADLKAQDRIVMACGVELKRDPNKYILETLAEMVEGTIADLRNKVAELSSPPTVVNPSAVQVETRAGDSGEE
jgi:hypothetical protein